VVVKSIAGVVSDDLFGRQFPCPSEKYPLGHALITEERL